VALPRRARAANLETGIVVGPRVKARQKSIRANRRERQADRLHGGKARDLLSGLPDEMSRLLPRCYFADLAAVMALDAPEEGGTKAPAKTGQHPRDELEETRNGSSTGLSVGFLMDPELSLYLRRVTRADNEQKTTDGSSRRYRCDESGTPSDQSEDLERLSRPGTQRGEVEDRTARTD